MPLNRRPIPPARMARPAPTHSWPAKVVPGMPFVCIDSSISGSRSMLILALDVSMCTVKAAVLDLARAEPVGPIAQAAYALDHPTSDAVEISADRLWSAFTSAARHAAQGREGIEGVGLSCLSPGLVLLDDAGRPLSPIWTPLDRRARPAARQVWAAVGNEFLATTGNRPLPGGISAVCYRQQINDSPYVIRKVR